MLDEDTNGALLRLFHCFLHAAPQALLQLTILLTKRTELKPGKCKKTVNGISFSYLVSFCFNERLSNHFPENNF